MDMEEMESQWGYRPDVIRSAMSALDWHLGYFEWQGSAKHEEQMDQMSDALLRSQGRQVAHNVSDNSHARALANDESRLIDMAQTVWVEADICTIIEHGVENMPNGVLREEDLPMDHGLLVFSRPLQIVYRKQWLDSPDITDLAFPLRALAWSKVYHGVGRSDGQPPGDGLYIWLYTDRGWIKSQYLPVTEDELRSAYPDRDLTTGDRVAWTEDGPRHIDWDAAARQSSAGVHWPYIPGPELMPTDITAWLFNDEWDTAAERQAAEAGMLHMRPQMVQVRKYLLALFLYMKEQIVDTSFIRLPRASRRRAERAKKELPEAGSIRVVHLRKVVRPHQTPGGDGDTREWTHRWWVRAHWRQIKAKDGKSRLIPVRAHVKGPDDKPLVVKSEIYSVDR